MFQTISILGCGWLGLPLAQRLISLGYTIKGSTTTPSKVSILREHNINPYLLKCQPAIQGDNIDDFFNTDCVFINIPFKRNLKEPLDYFHQMHSIYQHVMNQKVKKVILASTTAVYPEANQIAREDDVIVTSDERSQVMLEVERLFLTETISQSIVIRFGGLYGPNRDFGNFLKSKRVQHKDGHVPVNFIHQEDCIGIVVAALQKELTGQIINAVGDGHPLRKDLYTHVAIAMGMTVPEFSEDILARYKIVDNSKVKNLLNYRFIYPSPWDWIR